MINLIAFVSAKHSNILAYTLLLNKFQHKIMKTVMKQH
jgi:hypothetical protein